MLKKFADLQLKGNVQYSDCIKLSFDNFVAQHITRIKNLVHWFPEDELVKDDNGQVIGKFWSGHKKKISTNTKI